MKKGKSVRMTYRLNGGDVRSAMEIIWPYSKHKIIDRPVAWQWERAGHGYHVLWLCSQHDSELRIFLDWLEEACEALGEAAKQYERAA